MPQFERIELETREKIRGKWKHLGKYIDGEEEKQYSRRHYYEKETKHYSDP